ncbi:hypothetical protein BJY01DRAFT_230625 [Aspergillus pseudoustus]|uniref:GPI anchored protein n=1 Tax=Aspergillus pseudoustus TaxID=1810923 RepID=A0ABR4I7B6_9EURO
MMIKSLLLPALASVAYAESTVTSMFIFGADPQPLAASIVGNDQTATTYSINCPPGTDGNDCGMGPGMTLVAGKDVTSWIFDDGPAFQYTAECSIKNSKAVCTESAGGSEANFPGVSTTTTTVDYMPVTITAGSITGADSESTTDSATSTSSATAGSTSSAAQASETPSGSESDSASETPSQTGEDASPTGAAGKVVSAAWVMGAGAVVAIFGAFI